MLLVGSKVNRMSSSTIDFLDKWQTMIGSGLGPFLAVVLSAIGFWIKSKLAAREELKESLRRITIGIARSINGLFTTQKQIRVVVKMIDDLVSQVERVTDDRTYVLDKVNFPITGEIYRDADAGLARVKSYYLHNKLLFIDSGLKDLNKVLQNLKEDFEALIRQNQMMAVLDKPPGQRRAYAQNLRGFAEMLRYYADKGLPIMIKLMMQTSVYNEYLRKGYQRTLWKYESTRFKYFRNKAQQKSYGKTLVSVDRIDAAIEEAVKAELKQAADRAAFLEANPL